MWDPISTMKFLVNIGAWVSILPTAASHKLLPLILNLLAANGLTIPVNKFPLNLKVKRTFQKTFYLADVSQAILGVDLFIYILEASTS